MTLEWIPLETLEPHPENANVMPERLLAKLKAHLARTGRYEPLVVRPLSDGWTPSLAVRPSRRLGQAGPGDEARYQILNGHHRARALADLGHTHARCDVWDVDDDEARLLLATLNRLEGRDDPSRRAALVARLADGPTAADLARLLPEPADALERLTKLAEPPPTPADPAAAPLPRAMTFFLDEDQEALVREALGAASGAVRAGGGSTRSPASGGGTGQGGRACPAASAAGSKGARPTRADALARLAQWYLEARGLR